jgi:hypothetical protein
MMKMRVAVLGLSCLLALPLAAEEKEAPIDPQIKAYRLSLKDYGMELKGALQTAMKQGGPVAALTVCHMSALPITQKHSDMHAWEISRTSLKPRNADNQPDAWESKVMQDFDARNAAGEKADTLEFSEIVTGDDGSQTMRYMRAIPTDEVCLTCHGSALKDDVSAKLKALYPDDQAVGFKVGDLRGAFSISEPVK